jgi:formylglycine-generating enzyme required for sulfatase activity
VISGKTIGLHLSALVALSAFMGCSKGGARGEQGLGGPPAAAVGDPYPEASPPEASCVIASECRSGVCNTKACRASSNTDGVRNGDETDVDCGGNAGPPCGIGKTCATDAGCESGLCKDGKCGEPVVKTCGGAGELPRCADGELCADPSDCASATCIAGTCRPFRQHDGIMNDDETDIDCGGSHPDKCGTDLGCAVNADCQSVLCNTLTKKCLPPAFDDQIKNGLETDVDCGGPDAPQRCAVGQGCKVHSDCVTNGCTYEKKCAVGATCTQLEGGQTCGPNDGLGKQQDCCSRAPIGPYTVDKYLITAGRMRAFLGRLDGKVRDWASTLPASRWNQAWTPRLPNSFDGTPGDIGNANTQLGPHFSKRACETGSHTGHTFWTPPWHGDFKDFSQSVLDAKALNCVPWHLMAALCAFDGGHLLTEAELRAAYTNNGTTVYPWGARSSYTTIDQTDYAVQLWSYATPNPPLGAGKDLDGYTDVAFYIAPPGRRPLGYNATGHTDLVGNLLEWVGDSERQFVWKGSFENHAREGDMLASPIDDNPWLAMRDMFTPWRWNDVVAMGVDPENVNGYYGLGGRCGY